MIKPTVLFILVISIAGYVFCNRSHMTRIKLKNTQGYHTFLYSAGWGLGLFLFSAVLFLFCFNVLCEDGTLTEFSSWVGDGLKPFMDIDQAEANLAVVSILTLIVSLTLPRAILFLACIWTGRKRNMVRIDAWRFHSITDETHELCYLTFKSFGNGLPISLTLSSGKIYVGYLTVVPDINVNDLQLLPLASGYRTSKRKMMKLVTDYVPVLEEVSGDSKKNVEQFLISIPIREVVHAHLHDFSYMEHFEKVQEGAA